MRRSLLLLAAILFACIALSSCRSLAERLWMEEYRRQGGGDIDPKDTEWL